jgi:hypothetical protein
MTRDDFTPWEDTNRADERLPGKQGERQVGLAGWLEEVLDKARDKEFLLIHNPGGWGSTRLEQCLDWERSIVAGVSETIGNMGRSWALVQYFRSGNRFLDHMRDIVKETRFFFWGQSSQAKQVARYLQTITSTMPELNVVLVGASQGAAFSNAVMRRLNGVPQIYSVELGIFFPHMSRRVVTERTLAIDNNGLMPDPMSHRNLWAGFKAYSTAFFRWFKYRIRGKPTKFTNCINVPGHEYRWEYPEVRRRIEEFFQENFGTRAR